MNDHVSSRFCGRWVGTRFRDRCSSVVGRARRLPHDSVPAMRTALGAIIKRNVNKSLNGFAEIIDQEEQLVGPAVTKIVLD